MLECCGCIGKSEWHDEPLKGTIMHPECGLPFVPFSNANKMVSMAEVKLGIDPGLLWGIE